MVDLNFLIVDWEVQLFVLVVILAHLYIYWKFTSVYKFFENQNIQGPKPKFFFGTWFDSRSKFLGDEDISLTKQYGKIVGTFDGITPNAVITHPDIIKQILSLSADKFQDRRVSTTRNPVLRKSLLSLCGEEEKEIQSFIATHITEEKIQKLLPRIESSASTLTHNLTKKIEENKTINLTDHVEEFIEDVIALSLFGIDLNSDGEFRDEFISNVSQIFNVRNPNSYFALIPFLYPLLQGDSWIIPQKSLKFFTDLIATGIKETPRNSPVTEGKAAHLIDILVEASEEEKKSVKKEKEDENPKLVLTDDVIVSKCLSAILTLVNAARSLILFTVYELAKNQEVQERLSEEIQRNKSDNINCADLKNCRYLDKILNETLRLYPFEFRIEKICKEPITLGPVQLDKGNKVSIPLFSLHRNDEFYPEGEKFDPSRFDTENLEKRNPFTYLPFGQSGLNSCIQLGVLVSKLTVYKLVEKLKFTKSEDGDQKLYRTGITGVPQPENLQVSAELRAK
uniref:Cytochrome P450 n=1 Tax=Liposcelis entomophila TaxID=550478 RepID=A0A0U4HLZ5_9NEOP|nr:cytochrome P450 [Liposcelis entomophila]